MLLLVCSFLGCTRTDQQVFSTENLQVEIDSQGQIRALTDRKRGVNYVKTDHDSPVLAIRVGGTWEQAQQCTFDKTKGVLQLRFPTHQVEAKIAVEEKDEYLTLELVALTQAEKVELVLWGSWPTSIRETIGETIGVVRNQDFAIGIQSLNPRTLGGFPDSEDDATPSYDIFSTTSQVDIADSLNVLYRGHTALPRDYGSDLHAYTRNRSQDRIISTMKQEHYLAPAFEDEGLVGSKVALFGCSPAAVLDVIEQIELTEGLPHPMLNGVWAKREKSATAAYLIQNFTEENIAAAIALTRKAGLSYLYHFDPFLSWGHFELKPDAFPENWISMKNCVEKAESQGIKLGVHTLSNFLQTNDPYVSPVPDPRLAQVGSSSLSLALDPTQKDIQIADPVSFRQMENNNLHAAMIGTELIRYEKVSEQAPWTLLNCERGAFGTQAASHPEGTKIAKLADHAYKTFLTNTALSIEVSQRIADLFNQTGLKQISFDGLEGNHSTGMGAYGELLFVKAWYDQLEPAIKNNYIMDASRPGHYFWHLFTRMNWGEPWYAGFRESQTAYRLLNQDYFRRNFIPCMLGWFSMRETTSIEDIEWLLARSAAFDAGYSLLTSPEIIAKNGAGEQILEKIKQWEKARMSGAFSAEQKKRMERIEDEFSLHPITDNAWELTPYTVKRYEHTFRTRQPGEPVGTSFSFENVYPEQPLGFVLNTTNKATASGITIEIDDFKTLELAVPLKPDQYLKYEGGQEMVLYDANWHRLQTFPLSPDDWQISPGTHQIRVDCTFSEGEDASLKLELKTKGPAEKVVSSI